MSLKKRIIALAEGLCNLTIEVGLNIIFVLRGLLYFVWSLISSRKEGLRSKYFREHFEKWFSYLLVLSLLALLCFMGYYFIREFFDHKDCLEQYATTVANAVGHFLRILGGILLAIGIFEFLRRVREYLPLSRPAPRPLLASFGVVVLISVMSSILVFANLPELLSGEKPLNLLFLGIVFGISVLSLSIVYRTLPYVISKLWVSICQASPDGKTGWSHRVTVSFLVKEKERKPTKAIKIEILGNKRIEFDEMALLSRPTLTLSDTEIKANEVKIKVERTRLDGGYSVASIFPVNESNLYSFTFFLKSEGVADAHFLRKLFEKHIGIYINLEDENGRDITVREKIEETLY